MRELGFKGRFAAEKQENSGLGAAPRLMPGMLSKDGKMAHDNESYS
jgi:hypothetical protein